MRATVKRPVKEVKKAIPPPGRKMSKHEAREYVFKTYRETMALLARH